ncbi:MAG: hypothetical protein IKE62_01190 [Oscillospiraceae bacterium]|nr:hypothetical protein [Oscillospiraceae bacterium]
MTSRKQKALAALLTYPTRKEAARVAGITDRTMRGYFQDAEFRAAYSAAYSAIAEDATRQAQRLVHKALNVFSAVMDDPRTGRGTRVQAAAKAIEYALKLQEQNVLLYRIEALEKKLEDEE